MTFKLAINGYGRIGRNVLRALLARGQQDDLQIVAINDLSPPAVNAHLTQYDTTHGPIGVSVSHEDDTLIVDGHRIRLTANRDPEHLPWAEMGIDCVLECTGRFASAEGAQKHLNAGAKKVLVSAPAGADVPTVVYGVNQHILTGDEQIISNASCTTNCLAPVAKVLHECVGIESGLLVTVHAYTNDQHLIDSAHKDLRRARSATQSMIPTKTGAAKAVGLVLPELSGLLDGYAVRVPTINVSMIDLCIQMQRPATEIVVNEALQAAANAELSGVLACNTLPLVSSDFNHHPASSIADLTQTKVMGKLLKIVSWYDNEWGFSCRMLDTALHALSLGQ